MLKDEDDLTWYARKADALRKGIAVERVEDDAGRAERVSSLLEALRRGGIKGSLERRTLYTRRLPPGCRGCLAGKGTNAFVTGKCTRDCFFCFNQKPRTDELVVHGIRLAEPEEAPEVVRRYGLRSVGVSGGEPTMRPERLLRLVRALRTLPFRVRIDLYTNGDRLSDELLSAAQGRRPGRAAVQPRRARVRHRAAGTSDALLRRDGGRGPRHPRTDRGDEGHGAAPGRSRGTLPQHPRALRLPRELRARGRARATAPEGGPARRCSGSPSPPRTRRRCRSCSSPWRTRRDSRPTTAPAGPSRTSRGAACGAASGWPPTHDAELCASAVSERHIMSAMDCLTACRNALSPGSAPAGEPRTRIPPAPDPSHFAPKRSREPCRL